MTAYYNEHDPYAAQWLRNLIGAGHIAPGDVDERSIAEVTADELRGYTQAHFFAGIGGWSAALRLAGWPDDRSVWTGSCPCQPFSVAGQRKGYGDERHLWPVWQRLIAECKPATVFGEQVASAAGRDWLADVRDALEALGYAVGAADLCAAGAGAPHIRQRLWFVADASGQRHDGIDALLRQDATGRDEAALLEAAGRGEIGELADAADPRSFSSAQPGIHRGEERARSRDGQLERSGSVGCGNVGHASNAGLSARQCAQLPGSDRHDQGRAVEQPSRSPWADLQWLACADGKVRPTQSPFQCMVDGVSACLGSLRPEQKKEVIDAATSTGLADETLRALRDGYGPEEIWQSLGGRIGFSKATLLLASLLEQSGELGRVIIGEASGVGAAPQSGVRSLRSDGAPARSPHRSQLPQQRTDQFADAVHSLSLRFAPLNESHGVPLAHDAINRVGRLRAYGNAIVPQIAAEFIGAAMDAAE